MGFLDKVKDTASKAADQVQKAAETGQDKLEESKLKKKVGDLKEELGGVVYGAARRCAPPGPGERDRPARGRDHRGPGRPREAHRRRRRAEHLTAAGPGC